MCVDVREVKFTGECVPTEDREAEGMCEQVPTGDRVYSGNVSKRACVQRVALGMCLHVNVEGRG